LNNLGIRLSNLGRREQALTATTEAVEIYRRLAAANPAAFVEDLHGAMESMANALDALGRNDDATRARIEIDKTLRKSGQVNRTST
jgi:tetratricopeptide (TPR) repeat protein